MRQFLILIQALLFVSIVEPVFAGQKSDETLGMSFYEDRERGWFWHEEELEDEIIGSEELAPPSPAPEPQTPEAVEQSEPETHKVVIDAAWLRENIPVLREQAINDPSDKNLAAYYYAQRMMLDISSRFAARTKQFFAKETQLSEENRRPTKAFILNMQKENSKKSARETLKTIFEKAGIWVFFRSDCSYCHKQAPILRELKRKYGTDILFVSIGGSGSLEGFDDFTYVDDTSGIVRGQLELEIKWTPTILLVQNDGKTASILSEGMITLSDLEQTILQAAKETGLLKPEEFMKTQEVRDINVLDDNALLEFDVDQGSGAGEESDVLVQKLKQRLERTIHSSASKIEK